jgi:hypothetical protein
MPRLPIASVMLAVAIAALDFGAIRALADFQDASRALILRHPRDPVEFERIVNNRTRADLLVTGALPMGNLLAVCLLANRRRRSRPFLRGFEVFGATALAVYIAAASCVTDNQLRPYIDLVHAPLGKSFGPSPTLAYAAVVYLIFVVLLALPQMAFALMGGLIFRRFRTAERQHDSPR